MKEDIDFKSRYLVVVGVLQEINKLQHDKVTDSNLENEVKNLLHDYQEVVAEIFYDDDFKNLGEFEFMIVRTDEMERYWEQINNIQSDFSDQDSKLRDLDGGMTDLQEDVEKNNSSCGQNNRDIQDLQDEVKELQDKIDSIKEDSDNKKPEEDVEEEIDALHNRIDRLEVFSKQ